MFRPEATIPLFHHVGLEIDKEATAKDARIRQTEKGGTAVGRREAEGNSGKSCGAKRT